MLLLHVGHIRRNKNQLLLVQALEKLPARFKLVLVGPAFAEDQPYLEALRQEVVSNGLEERVHVEASFRTDVELFMRAADVFLLPSKREGLGNVMLEALCTGLPVAAPTSSASLSGVPAVSRFKSWKEVPTGCVHRSAPKPPSPALGPPLPKPTSTSSMPQVVLVWSLRSEISLPSSVSAIEESVGLCRNGGTICIVGMPPSGAKAAFEGVSIADEAKKLIGSKMGSTRLQIDMPRLVELYQQLKPDMMAHMDSLILLALRNENLPGLKDFRRGSTGFRGTDGHQRRGKTSA